MQYYVRIGSLDGFVECLEQIGASPYELLEQVKLLPSQLTDPDLMVPYTSVGELLEISVRECQQPLLGIRISRLQGLSSVGLVGAHMVQQPTIADALNSAQRFSDMHAQGVELALDTLPAGQCQLSLNMQVNSQQQFPQLVQMSIGLLTQMITDMTESQWKPDRVFLRQEIAPRQKKQLAFVFGCPVETSADKDALVFSRSVLQCKPNTPANLLDNIIEKQFHERQLANVDHKKLVQHAINVLLPTGDCSKETIAASLGMHPKKIERLLAGQNATFRQLLEDTRKEIALKSLSDKDTSMMNLALNLGYSDFSAFSRSFKKWTGMPPTQFIKAS